MERKKEQYEKIKDCIPKQRKPAKMRNLEVLNAVRYVVENGCKWRRLPKEYGDWHVIYVRVNHWAKKGVLEEAFVRLQQLGIIQIQVNTSISIYLSIKSQPKSKWMGSIDANTTILRQINAPIKNENKLYSGCSPQKLYMTNSAAAGVAVPASTEF